MLDQPWGVPAPEGREIPTTTRAAAFQGRESLALPSDTPDAPLRRRENFEYRKENAYA